MFSKQAFFNKLGYVPHSPGQQAFHDSTARFKVAVCGRRYGKSKMAGTEVAASLMSDEEARIWIIGPTYDLAEKEFRVCHHWLNNKLKLQGLPGFRTSYNIKTGSMSIKMPWGGILECRSADKPDSLVGDGLSGVIMAEAAKHHRETWEKYIRPALADRHGWAIFPTTPEGYNWVYDLYGFGMDPDLPDYECWTFPAWENPIVYPGGREDPEIKAIELTSSSTEWFDQEIGAKFTAFAGKIYGAFDDAIHVVDYEYNPKLESYLGFDFGYTNPFSAIGFQVTPEDDVYVFFEYYERQKPTFEHGLFLKDLFGRRGWQFNGRFGDPAGADAIATLSGIIGYVHSEATEVETGIEEVQRLLKPSVPVQNSTGNELRPRLFVDRRCINLIREFNNYKVKPAVRGGEQKEFPKKVDDHALDALRYGIVNVFKFGYRYKANEFRKDSVLGTRDNAGIFTMSGMKF